MNEDDLEAVLSPKKPEPRQPVEAVSKKEEKAPAGGSSSESLRKLLENKLEIVSKQLDSTTDLEEQTKLLDLISKYVETLGKIKKSDS